VPQIVTTLQAFYRDRGFGRARIETRTDTARDPSSVTLVFVVDAGARARLGNIEIQAPDDVAAGLLNRLGIKSGSEYDGAGLDARLVSYANELRAKGYYETRVTQFPRFADEDRTVDLVISVDRGPLVEVIFEGDTLTERERQDLVPIAREHSADEDLLEDAKFNIERHFRNAGFCEPKADYTRQVSGDVLRLVFTVNRGPRCVLERIEVSGNESVTTPEIMALMQSRPGTAFLESTILGDAARIQGLYRQRGFPSVKVSPQIESVPGAGSASVRVRVEIAEGVRTVVGGIVFDGNAAVGAESLRQAITSRTAQSYFEPQIAGDVDRLLVLYLNQGYQSVSVHSAPQFSADRTSVDLHFVISEGQQVRVDHVLIVGNVRTKTDVIAREVQISSGEPLSLQDEDETRSRLTALGLFRRVEISYLQLPGTGSHRDVVIEVEEAPVTTIGYGGGVEGGRFLIEEEGTGNAKEEFQVAPRGFFQVSRRNLFGGDRTISLFTRVSFRKLSGTQSETENVDIGGYGFHDYLARVAYSERRLFRAYDGTFSAGIEQGVRSSFNFNRRDLAATLGRRLTRTLAISGRYTIDRTELFDVKINPVDKPLIDRLFPQVRLSSFSGSLIRDTRNDALEPASGGLIGIDGEVAARVIGSEVGFVKTFLQGFAFRRIGPRRTVLALGARLGLASGFPREVTRTGPNGESVTVTVDDLPASERFYAGGDTTVRGFTLDRLGTPETIDADGFPTGGHGLVVLNAELRIPLKGSLGMVTFVDAGNVFLNANDIDLGELRPTAGFGIRYRSPVGPIRVDLGIKLDQQTLPTGVAERRTAVHISLGQAF
jgi:outer membrane protein assembly complex protein YaeT